MYSLIFIQISGLFLESQQLSDKFVSKLWAQNVKH